MTWAPRGIFSTKSASVGRTAGSRAPAGDRTGGGRAAAGALLQLFLLGRRLGGEQRRRLLEESEVKGVLGARRLLLDGVEGALVAKVAIARRHRAFLDLVVDAGQHAVGGRL